jgi:hypothetical protein
MCSVSSCSSQRAQLPLDIPCLLLILSFDGRRFLISSTNGLSKKVSLGNKSKHALVHSIYLACLLVGCVVVMFFNGSAHGVMFPDISTVYRWTVDMRQRTNYQSESAQILFSHVVIYCISSRVYVVFTYLHIFGTTTMPNYILEIVLKNAYLKLHCFYSIFYMIYSLSS